MTITAEQPTTATPQVAINDIGSQDDFLAAVDATIKYFNDGDIVEGVIVKVDRDEVLLDIGYKTEGVIPSRELSIKHDVDPNEVVKVGDEIEALVLTKEDKEGRLILSKKRAQYERAWGTIEKIKEEDGVVKGHVIEVVKGGLIIDIGLRGFLPASLVEMRRVRDLQPYVGKELEAKIIELDKNRNNVVLSRRAWLEQTQCEVRQTFLTTLQKGQVRSGVVSSIVNFGAFVDLGGVDGLVHVSELSWKHIDHPSEVVEVGLEVTVEVLDVDMDRERVSLSLKATQEDPWQQFARTHQIGQVVPGKVTKLVPFGAFVRVDEGIEGLVHISELAERHVELPEQVVNVNDDLFVKVIDIDLERRRISLCLKQANEGTIGEAVDFDPTMYGMAATYDEAGNYIYPDGFDPETGEWLPGYEEAKEAWEKQYADAQARWEAHKVQVVEAKKADAEATTEVAGRRRVVVLLRHARRGRGRHPGLRRGAGRAPREALRRRRVADRWPSPTPYDPQPRRTGGAFAVATSPRPPESVTLAAAGAACRGAKVTLCEGGGGDSAQGPPVAGPLAGETATPGADESGDEFGGVAPVCSRGADDKEAKALEAAVPTHVRPPLGCICAVLVALVLARQPGGRIQQVRLADENPVAVEHGNVHQRHRQAGLQPDQTEPGLLGGSHRVGEPGHHARLRDSGPSTSLGHLGPQVGAAEPGRPQVGIHAAESVSHRACSGQVKRGSRMAGHAQAIDNIDLSGIESRAADQDTRLRADLRRRRHDQGHRQGGPVGSRPLVPRHAAQVRGGPPSDGPGGREEQGGRGDPRARRLILGRPADPAMRDRPVLRVVPPDPPTRGEVAQPEWRRRRHRGHPSPAWAKWRRTSSNPGRVAGCAARLVHSPGLRARTV